MLGIGVFLYAFDFVGVFLIYYKYNFKKNQDNATIKSL